MNLLPRHTFSFRDESPTEGMLKHTLEALLRTHATAFEALWEAPERLPNGLWKWDVRHSMWVERQKVIRPACDIDEHGVPVQLPSSSGQRHCPERSAMQDCVLCLGYLMRL